MLEVSKVKLIVHFVIRRALFISSLFFLIQCIAVKKSNISVTLDSQISKVNVTSIDVLNNQLVIKGTNLSAVKKIGIKGNSIDESFSIETKDSNQIVANSLKNISLTAGQIFDLILSDAKASATFQINLGIANGSVKAIHLNSMGATSGQVLKFNGTSWAPASQIDAQVYMGTWDSSTGQFPDITQSASGDYYIVSVASGSFSIGDWIISDGYNWTKVAYSKTAVSSFNGRKGIVTLTPTDYVTLKDPTTHKLAGSSLGDFADVDLSANGGLTSNGLVLKWNSSSSKWEPGAVSAGGGGTITNVTASAPLSVTNGATTPALSITQATTSTNGYLSSTDWNTFNNKQASITAGTTAQYYRGDKTWQTLNTNAVAEHASFLYFTNARVLGVPLTGFAASSGAVVATDTTLAAFGKVQGQINSITTGNANYLVKNGTDAISGVVNVATTGLLQLAYVPVGLNDATNKTYVDTKLALTGGTVSGDVSFDTQLKLKNGGAANYITVKAPATGTTAYTLTLPDTAGSANQVLITDGAGVTSWGTPGTADVLGSLLTGFSASNSAITATDSVLIGFNKAQGQITNLGTIKANVAGDTFTGDVTLNTQLKLKNGGAANFITIKAPAAGTTAYTLSLPASAGTANQVLTTDGAGVTSWTSVASSATPTGSAGGDLSGTYPNPTISGLDAAKISSGAVSNTEFNYLDGVTSSIQTQLNAKQAIDATLTALAAHNTNGILVQTAADTFVGRSIAGTANRLVVTNGDGVAGNPTANIDTTLLPSPVAGDAGKFLKASGADASAWSALGSSDITTALGFTPINKAGDSISTGTFTLSGTAVLRTPDPVGVTDVANKQYVDGFGQWIKNGSDIGFTAGKVGIGTTAPGSLIHVSGISSSAYTSTSSSSAIPNGEMATIENTDTTDTTGALLQFVTRSGGNINRTYIGNVSGSNISGNFVIGQRTGATAYSERLRIDSNGNVGIGTTNPISPLHSTTIRADNTFVLSSRASLLAGTTTNDARLLAVGNLELGAGNNYATTPMILTSAGNVGIGTVNPAHKLEVRTDEATAYAASSASLASPAGGANIFVNNQSNTVGTHSLIRFQALEGNGANDIWYAGLGGTATSFGGPFVIGNRTAAAAYGEKFRITASGNVGIGTTSPFSLLANSSSNITSVVGGTGLASASLAWQTNVGGYVAGFENLATGTAKNGILIKSASTAVDAYLLNVESGGSNRLTVRGDGNVGIGTTAPAYMLDINGDTNIASANALRFGGTSVCTSAGCTSSSDKNLKENIKFLVQNQSLENILKLQGVEYDYKDKKKFTDKHQIGVIAQDVEKVYPEVVLTDLKTGLKSVAYDHLIAPIIEAIKSLYRRIVGVEGEQVKQARELASVKVENDKLKRENAEIKARLDRIEKLINSKK